MSNINIYASRFKLALYMLCASFVLLTPSLGVISIVYQATGWKMPTWLGWVLVGAGSVSVVIGLLSTYGGIAVAPAVAKAILAADSVSL